MADATIDDLTALTGAGVATDDSYPVYDKSATITKKHTPAELAIAVQAATAAGGIPLAKLGTDPVARSNHTGTQLAATISDFDTQVATTAVLKSLYDANTILAATSDNTPVALTVGASTIVARLAAGGIVAATVAQIKTLLALASTDISDFTAAVYAAPLTINAQTGTTYTTVLGDAGALVTASNSSAISVTIPPNSSVAYPAGTVLTINQIGAGQVTLVAGAGVTLNTPATLLFRTQYSVVSLVKTGTNTWYVFGDLQALGQTVNVQTGTTYGFLLSDRDKLVTMNNGSAITATIPANASVAFPVGSRIDVSQLGAGQVTIAITTDTLRAYPGAKLAAQYAGGYLIKIATTTWQCFGAFAS